MTPPCIWAPRTYLGDLDGITTKNSKISYKNVLHIGQAQSYLLLDAQHLFLRSSHIFCTSHVTASVISDLQRALRCLEQTSSKRIISGLFPISWATITLPRCEGGLGICRLHHYAWALIVKQAAKLLLTAQKQQTPGSRPVSTTSCRIMGLEGC